MKFDYIKTFLTSTMVAGAVSIALPAMAVAPVSVLPVETETQESLQDFQLVFAGDAVAEWTVTGTENTPKLYKDGAAEAVGMAGPSMLSADGNVLKLNWPNEFTKAGKYELEIPVGAYAVNGEAGEACKFSWDVTGVSMGYSVYPDVNVVSEIQNIRIVFNDADVVEMGEEWSTAFGAVLYIVNDDNPQAENRRGTFMPQFNGNAADLTMYSPITEPGEYYIEIPANAFKLDGVLYAEPITLNYTIAEPSYPEVDLSVNPSTSVVDEIGTIELTFGGVEIVEWAVTGTENAPYLEDVAGNRMATFAKLGGEGNMISCGMYADPFNVKGEYTVVIPAGSYVFQGIYHGMPGKEIRLNYEVLGLTGITVDPAVGELYEIQNIRLTFNEAKTVEMGEEWSTAFGAVLYIVNGDKPQAENRRATFMPQFNGNNADLTLYSPITEPGTYYVEIPAGAFKLDGVLYDEPINLMYYTIVEPSYPEVDLSVNPSTSIVDEIGTIELTFGGVEIVEWAVTGTENAPYMEDAEGNRVATFSKLGGDGNMISCGMYSDPFNVKGEYTVVIPAGSYVFQGIYHGMPGEEIRLNYEILGATGITVEPSTSILSEIQNIRIVFNEAKTVEMGEEWGTTFGAILYIVNDENPKEENRRATFMPQFHGNAADLSLYSPITEPGDYYIEIPANAFKLDGVLYAEPITLNYTIAESFEPTQYTVDPAEGTVESLGKIAITFADANEAQWNIDAIQNDRSLCPTIQGGDVIENLTGLTAEGNVLVAGPYDPTYEWTVAGSYVVTIPAGSYTVDGEEGVEIVLNYIVSGTSGIDAIFGDSKAMDVYDINGRMIMRGADAAALRQLRGIFVVGGKKYIIR